MPRMPPRFQRWIDARNAARHLDGRQFAKRHGGWHVAVARDRRARTALRRMERRRRRDLKRAPYPYAAPQRLVAIPREGGRWYVDRATGWTVGARSLGRAERRVRLRWPA